MSELLTQLKELEVQGYELHKPAEVAALDIALQTELAMAWVTALNKLGGNNTFHPEPKALLGLIQSSHTAIVTKGRQFVSAAKIQPWVTPDINTVPAQVFELDNINLIDQFIVLATEVGGIVTVKDQWGRGCGKIVAYTISEHGLATYQGPQLSIVRPSNTRSANIFHHLGWRTITDQESQNILGFDILGSEWVGSKIFVHLKSINRNL